MDKKALSKSHYIKGLQCPKMLWLYRNRKDLAPQIDGATQAKFDAGHEIGECAKGIYKDYQCAEIKNDHWDIKGAIENTEYHIKNGCDVIFEATAEHPTNHHYSRIDILKQSDDGQSWDMIEVKSSTSVKEYHLDDISFQYYVFHNAGYKINHCYIAVINNEYVRKGPIDAAQLLKYEDVTDVVLSRQNKVHEAVLKLENVLKDDNVPNVTIGLRCFSPFECDYKTHCWKHVPDYSIYNVLPKTKADELAPQYGYELKDLPQEYWPGGIKQKDIAAYLGDEIICDEKQIGSFLSALEYPLYFLDYETIGSAIPLYDGTKPYQAITFQYSLHIQQSEGGPLKHLEFLHQEQSDPREDFAQRLINDCGVTGSIIVYNKGFEAGRNNELAAQFPQYKDALEALNERMLDLLVPFKNRWLYHPNQKSSASIKAVLPSFTDLSYSDLEIGNGGDASQLYLNFMGDKISHEEADDLFQNLKAYCEQDTYAMVSLLDVLRKASNE